MGCRPVSVVLLTLSVTALVLPSLVAAIPVSDVVAVDPNGALPGVKTYSPDVNGVLVDTGVEATLLTITDQRAAATPVMGPAVAAAAPIGTMLGVDYAVAVQGGPGGAVTEKREVVTDDDFAVALGAPMTLRDDVAASEVRYAAKAATVPVPPTYAQTSSPITPTKSVETQEAATGRIVDVPGLGGLTPTTIAAAAAGLALFTLVPWALYHRIRGHSTLENRTRKSIYDLVAVTPGAGVQEVAEASGVTYSTASYHLDRLVGAGMLVVSAEGARLRYYKNGGSLTEDERKIVPILESNEACRVLEAILDRPYTYRAAIAERLGVSTTTVNWHLKRLLETGLVHEAREGRSAHLYADRAKLASVVGPLGSKLPTAPEGAQRIIDRVAAQSAPVPAAA